MIRGVDITVVRPSGYAVDRFGNDIAAASTTETVSNVLVSPGPTSDLEAARHEGVTVDFTLHFPKGYDADLEGCDIVLPAPWSQTCHVIGKPTPYTDVDTPTPWHMPVEVEVAHG